MWEDVAEEEGATGENSSVVSVWRGTGRFVALFIGEGEQYMG
jgi:hypothetical protein